VDRAVSLPGGGHRLPLRRRHRRRDRRASQAHGDRGDRLEPAAGAVVLARVTG
jgi:hypothetical protein